MTFELKHFRQINWCLRGFLIPFTVVFPSLLMASLMTWLDYKGISVSANYQGKFLVGSLVLMGLFALLGHKIYKKYIGPKICARGWNEYSYLRGLQMTLLSVLVLWGLPLMALALFFQVYKFFAG